MALANDVAKRFWDEDLTSFERKYGVSVNKLSATAEDGRVPNQGTVLAFSVVNLDKIVGRSGIKVWIYALGNRLKRVATI